MKRSTDPLVFEATDSNGSFTGKVIFENPSATAWSYDLQVTKPHMGQITGKLAEGNGVRFDPSQGTLIITKFWNKQVRIHEEYRTISAKEYSDFVSSLPKLPKGGVPKACL